MKATLFLFLAFFTIGFSSSVFANDPVETELCEGDASCIESPCGVDSPCDPEVPCDEENPCDEVPESSNDEVPSEY